MKILIATDSMDIGGAETHIFTLINELKKENHNITLISSGGVYTKILEKGGLRCIWAPFNKRDIFSIRKCAKILADEMKCADIIHTHTRFTSFLAKRIRGTSSYPSIITTAHLNFPLFPFGSFAFWGDATLAVSEDIRNYLNENYGIKKENVRLTRNSIDTAVYKKSSLNKKLIIHTSRIDKGRASAAFLLAESAEEILSAHPEWRIMIVGDGNLFTRLSKKVSEVNERLGFEGVILTGARSDIPSLLGYGSIFVGVSRSALEGMASGLPTIICGDEGYGGIVDNDNFDLLSYSNFCARGLKKPTKDYLIKDINFLISDTLLRKKLGECARKNIEEQYPASIMAEDAMTCYRKALKAPSVCLMGFFGYQNLGDEETLKCAVELLIKLGINNISVLSASNSLYKNTLPIKTYDRSTLNEVTKAINECDIFILCGGNLMQNETSTRSLVYYEQAVEFAKRRRKRVYMLSSGFGQIHGKLGKLLLTRGIKACDFCGCRTYQDLETATKHNKNSIIMPDFCFLLPEGKVKNPKNKTFIWILSEKESISIGDIAQIAERRSLTPIAINLFKSNDRAASSNARRAGITVITPKNFEELSTLFANAEFSVSERLHGAIFSIISHTPAYITTNNEKNEAMLNEINSRKKENSIIFPYSKSNVLEKKEIGACDSDFNYVINSLRQDISYALNKIF